MAGPAPIFMAAVRPQNYAVRFDDALATYVDEPTLNPRGVSFRFADGVRSAGTKMNPGTLTPLFTQAGLTDSEAHVMLAISPLEGSFDAINTYDTGIVSVGFIQFACRDKGAGSLGQVLLREKGDNPEAFEKDFRTFGVDVDGSGALDVVDPVSGSELNGHAAALKVVEDKRLTATFQRAGLFSDAFKIAQLETAKDLYFPATDIIPVLIGGRTIKVKVGDVIQSEAGLATLMDRKVHRGNLAPLASVLSQVARDSGIRDVAALAAHERDIVKAMIYRKDFLNDTSLSQPPDDAVAAERDRQPQTTDD
jgi:hypothetical protein